jgi:hypothetical protein
VNSSATTDDVLHALSPRAYLQIGFRGLALAADGGEFSWRCDIAPCAVFCSACAGLAGGLTGRPKLCPRQVCCPAALRINRVISSGCEISERWLAFTSMVWAPIRLAIKRSRSGLMVRSSVETA